MSSFTLPPRPSLIAKLDIEEVVNESKTTVFILIGVLVALVILNLFYKFFLQGFLEKRRNRRVEPQAQVIEVVVNNAKDNDNTIKNKSIENSMEMKEKNDLKSVD